MKIKSRKLEIAMINACVSVQELSNLSEVSICSIYNALKGGGVRIATIGKLAKALEVKAEDLI